MQKSVFVASPKKPEQVVMLGYLLAPISRLQQGSLNLTCLSQLLPGGTSAEQAWKRGNKERSERWLRGVVGDPASPVGSTRGHGERWLQGVVGDPALSVGFTWEHQQ